MTYIYMGMVIEINPYPPVDMDDVTELFFSSWLWQILVPQAFLDQTSSSTEASISLHPHLKDYPVIFSLYF